MSTPAASPSWYDVLGVAPDASAEEVRAAWRSGIADLDPTDRRFATLNQAAQVLLDPDRRAAYDADLADQEPVEEPEARSEAAPVGPRVSLDEAPTDGAPAVARRSVPGWVLATLAALALALGGATAYVATTPSDSSVEDATRAAQAAAERAVVPILSYDYRRLDEDQAAAQPLMTEDYREEYDQLFEVLQQNAPRTETVVGVEVVASGVVRGGTERAEFLVFLNRPTTNAENKEPVVYKDQVRVQMENVGGDWLVDCLLTSPNDRCE